MSVKRRRAVGCCSAGKETVMNRWICVPALALLLIVIPAGTLAAKHTSKIRPVRVEEDVFTFGKVVHVGRRSIVLSEYDFARDAEVNRTYLAVRKTEFGNVKKLRYLKAGDDVVIDYLVKNKKRIITAIVKEEKVPEKPRKLK
jgi:hypothetical protein